MGGYDVVKEVYPEGGKLFNVEIYALYKDISFESTEQFKSVDHININNGWIDIQAGKDSCCYANDWDEIHVKKMNEES